MACPYFFLFFGPYFFLKTIQVLDSKENICTNAFVIFSEQSVSPFARAGVGILNKEGNFTFETGITVIDNICIFAVTSNEFGMISMGFHDDFSVIHLKKGQDCISKSTE